MGGSNEAPVRPIPGPGSRDGGPTRRGEAQRLAARDPAPPVGGRSSAGSRRAVESTRRAPTRAPGTPPRRVGPLGGSTSGREVGVDVDGRRAAEFDPELRRRTSGGRERTSPARTARGRALAPKVNDGDGVDRRPAAPDPSGVGAAHLALDLAGSGGAPARVESRARSPGMRREGFEASGPADPVDRPLAG